MLYKYKKYYLELHKNKVYIILPTLINTFASFGGNKSVISS